MMNSARIRSPRGSPVHLRTDARRRNSGLRRCRWLRSWRQGDLPPRRVGPGPNSQGPLTAGGGRQQSMTLRLIASGNERALAIRDHVLPLLRRDGVLEVQRDTVRLIELHLDPWIFRAWTPFSALFPTEAASPGYRHAVTRQRARPVPALRAGGLAGRKTVVCPMGGWRRIRGRRLRPRTVGGCGPGPMMADAGAGKRRSGACLPAAHHHSRRRRQSDANGLKSDRRPQVSGGVSPGPGTCGGGTTRGSRRRLQVPWHPAPHRCAPTDPPGGEACPSRSSAVAWTNTSLPPDCGVMKPNPLSGLYHVHDTDHFVDGTHVNRMTGCAWRTAGARAGR